MLHANGSSHRSASLEFLKNVTEGAGKSIIQRCMTDERILQGELLEDTPEEHKPSDEWIAARLKIPHEFKTRLSIKAQRKLKHVRKGYATADEVWMHFKPTKEELIRWRTRKHCTEPSDDGEDHDEVEDESTRDEGGLRTDNEITKQWDRDGGIEEPGIREESRYTAQDRRFSPAEHTQGLWLDGKAYLGHPPALRKPSAAS